ncbi:OBERON-like protein [Selaginella moellendorffii]|uniref:OBERON-like protein n=1 Tax=Selaginella moellendorffii TaxID=88036 RepID=UPI000D1C88B3|nr:OBERON-like protein [Selaginella moellendorffii]|eukprot:XP_024527072.1 OBERON-like protein [Selaginella moellendorffii]
MSSSLGNPSKSKDSARVAQRNGDKRCSGERHSPSPCSGDKEVRYEFDTKIPKGHRTDREKKRVKRFAPGAEKDNAQVSAADTPRSDTSKHLKRLRTSRASRCQRRDEEVDAKPPQLDKVAMNDDQQDHLPVANPVDADKTEGEGRETQAGKQEADEREEGKLQDKVALASQDNTATEDVVNQEAVQAMAESLGNHDAGADAPQEEGVPDERQAMVVPEDNVPVVPEDSKLPQAEPDTSLSLGLSNSHRALNRNKSFQSMSQAETFSHGVTTSLSLSCSHPFTHNPSCSLTHNSHDYQEFSSASQPVRPEASSYSAGLGSRKMEFGDYARHHPFKGKAVSESNHFPHHSRPKGSMHRKQVKSSGLSQSVGSWERSFERDRASATLRVTVREVVADPVLVVAEKMRNLPRDVLDGLKASAKDLVESSDRREEFLQLQRILQTRNDLSSDALHKSHRTQVEILVAVKTGNPAFLLQDNQLKLLVEVLLHSRCRNVQCLSQLPVDNCECKICTQKNGFCNACMCVVCSKFDTAHSTCSWVGCDYCIHWCHTDCGLRKMYIKPGTTPGTSEMQFHCIACGHTSELFGFVKEVFASCAKSWNRGVLVKELDCARRMFQGSEDLRGRQLCRRAGQMIAKLESNNLDVAEACNAMLRFFEDSKNVSLLEDDEHATAGAARIDPNTVLERATLALQTYDRVLEEKRTDAAEMQYERARKKAEIEELESIVRIKQAEAKMFQARADEASREAEGLQRIVLAKCVKVEQEYVGKKSKLQLLEAEEKRKRKFEDLQFLEKGSSNFDIVRKLMGDLQDLLGNMEAAKQLQAEEVSGIEAYLERYLQSRVA